MYAWKYWRDTRLGLSIYIAVVSFISMLWLVGLRYVHDNTAAAADAILLWKAEIGTSFMLGLICSVVMGFVTGGNSAGSDIGNGLGDFLLTRPYTRRHLVWVGWVVGLAEVIALTALTVVMALGVFAVAEGPVWRRLQPHELGTVPVILILQIVLMGCVVYGLTYCCTILLRNSTRGILISISVVVAYSAINGLMEHWLGESLPSVTFAVQQLGAVSWYQNSIARLVGWAVIALLFPVLADLALGRADL